ncbi:hypothetical protein H2204_012904 [Knufia peltigerae]|uniref:Uncharacterized protein n=1 Tax=Knufia peltigerae TaxID=1002370 RepID=A0AA38XRG1_9EURO|nr:hypothetical protein H2204_012904 [Knufia peltigerae]
MARDFSLASWQDKPVSVFVLSCLPWVALLLCSYVTTSFLYSRRFQKTATKVATFAGADTKSVDKTENVEKPDWTSIHVEHFQPRENFDWKTQPEQPYRPWHNGPHHVTMGIKRTSLENWVEFDHKYLERYRYKLQLFTQHPEKTIQNLPGSEEASFEALYLLVDILPRRYPTMFQTTEVGIKNLITGDDWDLRRGSDTWKDHHPLQVMGLLSTEDWFIMQHDEKDPTGWKIQERIGHSLWEIHAGKVPQYEQKLAVSMDRFFQRLRVESPVMRFNYAIDNSPELFHINSHHNLNPDDLDPVELDQLFLRVERQVLQRLPKTRAIVFSIRTYVTPITEVTKDGDVAMALRTSVDSYGPELARYKNKPLWQDVLGKHLDEVIGDGVEKFKAES